jgi:Domain of unknown function (DUF1707)/Cell wall-active antibiotics response 4TMS YvqF
VAEALREAAGDGRLTLSELEERLEATFKARTYGDLEPITRDLPQGPYPVPDVSPRGVRAPVTKWSQPGQSVTPRPGAGVPDLRSERITTVLGEEKRTGRWEVPARIEVTCFLGEVKLDFTEAIVRHRDVVLQIGTVMGSVTLIVPDGIDVRMEPGANILGERRHKLTGPVTPGGPIYWVRGFVILGDITVRPPKEKRSLFRSR